MQRTITSEMNGDCCPLDKFEWSELYHILSAARRRGVLRLLASQSSWTLRDLATRVAKMEYDESEYNGTVRKTTYVSLYQTHLPKLDKLGVVDYDEEESTVETGDEFDDVMLLLAVGDIVASDEFDAREAVMERWFELQ